MGNELKLNSAEEAEVILTKSARDVGGSCGVSTRTKRM